MLRGLVWSTVVLNNKCRLQQWHRDLPIKIAILLGVLMLHISGQAWAALGAAVSLVSGQPGSVYPGETTQLEITLSNSNNTTAVSNVAFSNSLPGVWPNGLRIAAAATYTCTDPNTGTAVATTGTLTAVPGTQTITLTGGTIPQASSAIAGTCKIVIPVLTGSSSGNSATYNYQINNNAVTGNDPGAQSNSGDVSQTVNVRAMALPTVNKSFSASPVVLGGAPVTLTLTVNNPNPVPLANFSITDNFPTLGGGGAVIQVAATPGATATCTGAGAGQQQPAVGQRAHTPAGSLSGHCRRRGEHHAVLL